MLNPEFRWLDPEPEQIERLTALAAGTELPALPDFGDPVEIAHRVAHRLARPGIHPDREIHAAIRELGGHPAAGVFLGWPRSLVEALCSRYPEPRVLILGVFDGHGLWAGGLAGVSRGGLDFLTTFRFLWNDEPELASRQTLQDLHDICRAAGRRFGRPAGGVFLYRNEFETWRDQHWSWNQLQQFAQQGTAVTENL